ncbi:hypothetical protein CFRA_02945 [Corynebacterium frankenforstense DSM 45800]|uniref:N-acetylglucosaminyl-diphospho-decaprenol L-rhamnosyltransferase n=1 Tax=Corynebacterium frankenforstense DSM 45800 TaxID=1437875 RepID=A0A1L7CRD3_9CORY|nr:glycosyltransferase family 2 protein [Corynebacterium frankenforstense]APT88403.1 hypothetical protein CFRA_02945 [Corynebacterium frankenforstense DSM 45800]
MNDNAHAPVPVITVTYSPGRHLRALLESLPEATVRGTRTVLADNGSTDGVPQAEAAARDDVEFLDTGGNIGYGAAINAAWRHLDRGAGAGDPAVGDVVDGGAVDGGAGDTAGDATVDTEFLVVVNPDVVFEPGAIDAMIECARRHPEAGAIGPLIHDPAGAVYPSARELPDLVHGAGHAVLAGIWPDNPFTRAYRAGSDMSRERAAGWLSGSCLLLRREALEQIGGFDERYFMYLEDVDLGDRLARAGWSSVLCVDAGVVHDQGHAANAHRTVTSAAHHHSAYAYLADRHPGPLQAPLRLALRAGLAVRRCVATAAARLTDTTRK